MHRHWRFKRANTNKPFSSWKQYVAERRNGLSLATTDRLVVRVPVQRAVGESLSVRQVEVL